MEERAEPISGDSAGEAPSVLDAHQVRREVVDDLVGQSKWRRVLAALAAFEEAVGDLWAALRPLLIPIAAFLLVATFGLPFSQFALIWLIAVFVVNRAVFRPEGPPVWASLKVVGVVVLIASALVLMGVPQFFALFQFAWSDKYDADAFWSTLLIWISVGLCLSAIALRLFSYADSVMRIITSAVAAVNS